MFNIHITNSSLMDRTGFLGIYRYLPKKLDYVAVKSHRSEKSILREWAVHKFLWRLGLWRKRTISVDLNWPQKWYVRAAYFILGLFILPFYK